MRLIVETASFATEWAMIDQDRVIGTAETEVINPILQSRREISRLVRLNLPSIFFNKKYEKVYYYGVGCGTVERQRIVEASFVTQFKAPVIVDSSLLAAARGMLKKREGIACVLANNSGSCHYDGHNIVESVVSGGYLLGDEGSATVLGRIFLADVLKKIAPVELMLDFYNQYNITVPQLHEQVYEKPQPQPERFLASVADFLKNYEEHDYVKKLVRDNFTNFFERCVKQYHYQGLPFYVVGHMAFKFKKDLFDVAKAYGIRLNSAHIAMTPREGLIKYHQHNPKI